MYQNLYSYPPKQIKRAYDVQGRRGTEAEDCFPLVQDYKSLWREETKGDIRTIRYVVFFYLHLVWKIIVLFYFKGRKPSSES